MLNKATAIDKLRRQQTAIDRLPLSMSSPEFKKWKRDTEVAIANVFGEHTRHSKEFDDVRYGLMIVTGDTPDSAWTEACRDGLAHAKVMLQSMIDEIEEYWQSPGETGMPDRDTNTPEALLASLRSINQLTFGSDADLDKWKRRTEMVIRRVFGDKSRYLDDLAGLEFHPLGVFADQDEQEERWSVGRAEAGNLIATMLEDHGLEPGGPPALADPKPSSNVFVVHGHDNAMKEALCRTLAQLGLSPIVLHEQANRGRTIIEKFTDHAAVGFAVVLLSPDDVGCERGKEPDGLRPRARQNAVLELGFFVGRLGRGHVMALCLGRPEDLDIPSDYSGVVLTPFDAAGYWQFELVRELNAAGYSLDANKLLS